MFFVVVLDLFFRKSRPDKSMGGRMLEVGSEFSLLLLHCVSSYLVTCSSSIPVEAKTTLGSFLQRGIRPKATPPRPPDCGDGSAYSQVMNLDNFQPSAHSRALSQQQSYSFPYIPCVHGCISSLSLGTCLRFFLFGAPMIV